MTRRRGVEGDVKDWSGVYERVDCFVIVDACGVD